MLLLCKKFSAKLAVENKMANHFDKKLTLMRFLIKLFFSKELEMEMEVREGPRISVRDTSSQIHLDLSHHKVILGLNHT